MGEDRGNSLKAKLIERWKRIEELEGQDESSSNDIEDDFRRMKEKWFCDAFVFLHKLPKDEHCWCANKDVMLPLLEPFYNLPEDTSEDSFLRLLWRRVSTELRVCTRCVVQHHKAKEFYKAEYWEDVVGPLLAILQELDAERVALHLKSLLELVEEKKFDSDRHAVEVICVLFEVLMFPSLLEDAEVNETMRPFLRYVEASHDLTLAKGQHYPGVYTLLLHTDPDVRRVGLSLVKSLEKFKDAQDMEAILPLIEKVMHCLEYDIFDAVTDATRPSQIALVSKGKSRPRVGFTREALWLGLQIILSRLEPPAMEDGIVERYPVFVSIVLNQVSEATSVFYNALRCLRLLLEILGYKLWLRTTFSAGVVRNTLISQCFHSNQERMHKYIFDLFQPFLQSLEALQDKEYERQRRRLLYFLLQQVPGSKNFNSLMSRKARQIAYTLVERGYTMDPPLPPLDCAHVWGPPLVATLKDTSLHQSLRLPAFELFQIILVSDASALAALSGKLESPESLWGHLLENSVDDGLGAESSMSNDSVVGDTRYWNSFKKVSDSVGEGLENWSCIPLLWIEALEGALLPSPVSLCKAVLWALGRLAMVDPPAGPPSGDVLVTYAGLDFTVELSKSLKWEAPKGYDDRSDADPCRNVVPARQHCMELVSTFKRCADGFMKRLHLVADQLTWEPSFAEPLLLLLMTSNTAWREVDRRILSQFSVDSTLESGLELLCSSKMSVHAVGRAMHHASKTRGYTSSQGPVQTCLLYVVPMVSEVIHGEPTEWAGSHRLMKWPLLDSVRALNQLFFLGYKLLTLRKQAANILSSAMSTSQMGSYLPQTSQQVPMASNGSVTSSSAYALNPLVWQKLCGVVSSMLWPLLARIIMGGKHLIEDGRHEVFFTRTFQLLPLVCKNVPSSLWNLMFGTPNTSQESAAQWFQDLVALGSNSSRAVLRRWQDAILLIIEDLTHSEISISSALKQVVALLLQPESRLQNDQRHQLEPLIETLQRKTTVYKSLFDWPYQQNLTPVGKGGYISQPKDDVIDLDSYEETTLQDKESKETAPHKTSSNVAHNWGVKGLEMPDYNEEMPGKGKDGITGDDEDDDVEEIEDPSDSITLASFIKPKPPSHTPPAPQRQVRESGKGQITTLDRFLHKGPMPSSAQPQANATIPKPTTKARTYKPPTKQKRSSSKSIIKRLAAAAANLKSPEHLSNLEQQPGSRKEHERVVTASTAEPGLIITTKPQVPPPPIKETVPKKSLIALPESEALRELVMDEDDDMLTRALNRAKNARLVSRDNPFPRRRIMHLQMPGDHVQLATASRPIPVRAPPPRLDEWFRRILTMDYFLVIGIGNSCPQDEEPHVALTEVPTKFRSAEQYIQVFQPLLLEEFKAQLQNSYKELSLSDGMTCAVLRLMSLERVDDFQVGRFIAEGGQDGAARACMENDLLLLTRNRLRMGELQSCHMLAKVDRKDRENRHTGTIIFLKFCMPPGSTRLFNAKRLLTDRSKWHITRVMSLTPHLREFQALSAVSNFPLLQTLLCSTFPERDNLGDGQNLRGLASALQSQLRVDYNESQVGAIASAVGKQGVAASEHQLALVQGPPGTGKTRTIVGIVSALLARGPQISPSPSGKENLRAPTNLSRRSSSLQGSAVVAQAWQHAALAMQIGGTTNDHFGSGEVSTNNINRGAPQKQRVLVCAQSNAAVDELVSRMCKDGLYGSDGNFYKPFLVRVGNVKTVHPDSMKVFIETLVEERLGAERQNAANFKEEQIQQKTNSLRSKLEEVIEALQTLEALHSERNRGEAVVKNTSSAQRDSLVDKEAKEGATADKDPAKSEAAKLAAKVVEEGEAAVQAKLNILYSRRRQFSSELANAEKEEKKLRGEEWAKRQTMRKAVIREADVVVTTLSGCGGDVYAVCMESFMAKKKSRGRAEEDFFSAVVIDEAGQALEPATLIPLQLLAQTHARCVMVGDPKQLPATVLSQLASKMSYECSLFERLQRAGYPVTMLSTQYRMHPEIRQFPSAYFYDNRLTDGGGLTEGSRRAAFHKEWCFGPYVFFDVVEGCHRTTNSQSLFNEAEADAALQIYLTIHKRYPEEAKAMGFGVITPYKQQLKVLRDRFVHNLGSMNAMDIEFNTVDGFQGREVDILILSTVRASGQDNNYKGKRMNSSSGHIGFVADVRRMNVALTRAKFSLWIVGNASTLQQNSHWGALLENARDRHVLFPVKRPYVFKGDQPSVGHGLDKTLGNPLSSKMSNNQDSSEELDSVQRVLSSSLGQLNPMNDAERVGKHEKHGSLGYGGETNHFITPPQNRMLEQMTQGMQGTTIPPHCNDGIDKLGALVVNEDAQLTENDQQDNDKRNQSGLQRQGSGMSGNTRRQGGDAINVSPVMEQPSILISAEAHKEHRKDHDNQKRNRKPMERQAPADKIQRSDSLKLKTKAPDRTKPMGPTDQSKSWYKVADRSKYEETKQQKEGATGSGFRQQDQRVGGSTGRERERRRLRSGPGDHARKQNSAELLQKSRPIEIDTVVPATDQGNPFISSHWFERPENTPRSREVVTMKAGQSGNNPVQKSGANRDYPKTATANHGSHNKLLPNAVKPCTGERGPDTLQPSYIPGGTSAAVGGVGVGEKRPRSSPRDNTEAEYEKFQRALKEQKLPAKPHQPQPQTQSNPSVIRPPPTKRQKVQENSAGQSSKPVSALDDILSGLGSLTCSQVKGSLVQDKPPKSYPPSRP